MVVLGNPDAYHLPSTPGAGWFKVDATVYERFEAALVGAPHRTAPAPSARRPVLPFRPLAPVEGPLAGEGVSRIAGFPHCRSSKFPTLPAPGSRAGYWVVAGSTSWVSSSVTATGSSQWGQAPPRPTRWQNTPQSGQRCSPR